VSVLVEDAKYVMGLSRVKGRRLTAQVIEELLDGPVRFAEEHGWCPHDVVEREVCVACGGTVVEEPPC